MYLWPKVAEAPEHLFCGAAEDAGTHEHMRMLDAEGARTLAHMFVSGAETLGNASKIRLANDETPQA